MRALMALVLLAAALVAFAACDDDGGSLPEPEGDTTLTLEKSVEETGEGAFRFTFTLTNEGDVAAIGVAASDVWQEGLTVTSVEPSDEVTPELIGETGLELIFAEFEEGKSVTVVYEAVCLEPGSWENTARATAENADPAEAALSVDCP